jgi:hypothetical protein
MMLTQAGASAAAEGHLQLQIQSHLRPPTKDRLCLADPACFCAAVLCSPLSVALKQQRNETHTKLTKRYSYNNGCATVFETATAFLKRHFGKQELAIITVNICHIFAATAASLFVCTARWTGMQQVFSLALSVTALDDMLKALPVSLQGRAAHCSLS